MKRTSWQTTTAGLTSAFGVLLSVLLPAFGVDLAPGNIEQVAGAIAFLVGVFWLGASARDDNVSSEGTTARKNLAPVLLLALVAAVALPACTAQRVGGVVDSDAAGYRSEGSARNTTATNPDGPTVQDYAAEPPASLIVGREGAENYSAQATGSVSISQGDLLIVATVPWDFRSTGGEVPMPDGRIVRLPDLTVSASDSIIARAQLVTAMVPVIESWTRETKEAMLAHYQTQAALGDAFAQTIVPLIRASLGTP